jgi:NAD(P)-dependent dehydrogenase (short-subunit alcohol dehydrogenase family)
MGERVQGKVAVVFGGGQTPGETIGNGRATCLLLADEGATVVVVDRDLASAQDTVALVAERGGKAEALAADITNEDQVKRAIDAVVAKHGRIDILHNNVGASLALGDATATDLESDAFDRLVAVNLRGMWYACKHALPAMRAQGSGSIVNISSMAARSAYPYLGYKTTKAAVIAMTENLAAANARYGVRVNVILPGLMNTPMAIEARVAAGTPREEVIAGRDRQVPLGRKMGSEFFEVLEGLKPGEKVITSSYENFGQSEVLLLK